MMNIGGGVKCGAMDDWSITCDIEGHGGTIDAYSVEGAGTTFVISLLASGVAPARE